ncbi:CIC11C00000003243 [Sungouiella intermedia]|uniref:CIC11C00000003243 n=1 Tax=Sungouiella intermedia TaxID=45354 RepID=A0A1L0BC63_9ASCO|nr:CIC11C00000003243 [[Candida] intermedia]
MDDILAKASNQAMSFAIRSGISIASGFAIKTVAKLLDRIPATEKARIEGANFKLRTKINIISTSIDLIRLESARGNSALEPTLQMVDELKIEIDQFDLKVVSLLEQFTHSNRIETVKLAEKAIESLILSINDAIPLINLSLITCGVSFPSSISPKVSPSRLLQSTCHIHEANSKFAKSNNLKSVTVGPVFDLKLYTVFYNPSRLRYVEEDDKSSISSSTADRTSQKMLTVSWKEEFARALCKLVRLQGKKFEFNLVIEEDFDDGRYHEDDEKPKVKTVMVEKIQKQFFSASGHLLRLEGSNSPVLTLKIETASGFDYIALGEYSEPDDSEDESDSSDYEDAKETEGPKKTKNLSLLEYLLRLASLQEVEQKDILEVCDEKLSFYLSNQADNSVIPKSKSQKASELAQKQSNDQYLEHDSNTTRLGNLSLESK